MATKFVSVTRGNDATGDGSAANPWQTIKKAIGPTPAFILDVSNPNTLYIEPGVYREALDMSVTPTSAGPLAIKGDYDGAGFAAGGYATPVKGLVDWRGWSDDLTPIAAYCLGASNKSFTTVERIRLVVGGTDVGAITATNGASNWTISDCSILSGAGTGQGCCLNFAATAGSPLNATIQRCVFYTFASGAGAVKITSPLNSADWSLNVNIVNCVSRGAGALLFLYQSGGAGSFIAGGVNVQNCTVLGARSNGVSVYYNSTIVPASPVGVYDGAFISCNLIAAASGQIVEDGNVFTLGPANTLVTAGTHSKFNVCPAVSLGDERIAGVDPQPDLEPSASSPLLAAGNYGTVPTDDLWGKTRPATASAGALEIDVFSSGGGGGGGGGEAGTIQRGQAMVYQGDFGVGQRVVAGFGTAATLTAGAAKVVRDDDVESAAGVTLEVDRGSNVGRNAVAVDTGADPTFYADNHDYEVWLTAGTVSSASAVGPIGSFSLRNRPAETKSVAFNTAGIKSVGG